MDVVDELPEIDSLWNYEDPASSEAAFRALLPLASEREDGAYLAELLTQIARAEGLQRKFSDAGETLDRAESLLAPDDDRGFVRLYLERGRLLNSSGHPDQARPYFIQAFERGRESGEEFLAIDAAHMVAIAESTDGSIEWNLKGIALAKEAKDDKAASWQGSLHNNLGWTYHDSGRFDEALEQFEASLAFVRSANREDRARIARWTVARCLRSLGRYDEALAMQQANLIAAVEVGNPGGFIHEELGECLLALGREEESKSHFATAFELLSQDPWLVEGEPDRLARLHRLAGAESLGEEA